jgi:mannose-6-phosphate isomerase-like protein (cupin superfamily)
MVKKWGYYKILLKGKGFWVKRLTFKDGFTSLQKHSKRDEMWVIYVPKGVKHRCGGKGDLLEFAWGEPEERDITRYEVRTRRIPKTR